MKINQGIIELIVSHEAGEITFIDPAVGPGTYFDVGTQITKQGLVKPTMAQTASLVYDAWQTPKEQYCQKVISLLKNNWLWPFNGIRYVPNEGAYIQDLPEIKKGKVIVQSKRNLKKRLEAGDSAVRFVPFGYKIEEQTASELGKNPFIIGLAGEQGAEKFAEVAGKYGFNPYVWSFENVDEEIVRVPALYSGYCGGGLLVVGYYLGGDGIGFAFGVKRAAEGSEATREK